MEFEEITHTNIVILPKQNGPKLFWHFAKKSVALIRKKFWLVLLITTATTAGTFVVNEIRTPLYEASGVYSFESPGITEDAFTSGVALSGRAAANRVLTALSSRETLVKLENDASLLAILKAELAPAKPPQGRFAAAVSAAYDEGSRRFTVTANDPNPEMAVSLVRRVVSLYNSALPQTESLKNAARAVRQERLAALSRFKIATEPSQSRATPSPADTKLSNEDRPASVPSVLNVTATLPAPSSNSSAPSTPPFRLTELESQISDLNRGIASLQRILQNPSSSDLASAGMNVRSAYQAIGAARAKLQKALQQYQVPAGEKVKMEASIASAQVRFTQLIRSSLTTKQAQKRALQTQLASLAAQTDAPSPEAASVAAKITISRAAAFRSAVLAGIALSAAPDFVTGETEAAKGQPPAVPQIDESALADATAMLRGFSSSPFFPARLAVIREPESPRRPVLPDKTGNLLNALACGFFLGCGIAAFVGFKDEAVIAPADIEREFLVPVLGLIPKARQSC